MENWQSEYLQFTLYILATVWLLQRGSPESKELGKAGRESDEDQKVGAHASAGSPRWARVGGWRTRIYSNSLLIVMAAIWLASWGVQSITGRVAYNAEQFDHQQAAVSWCGYVGSSDFWNRTLQNWQSEFLAVGSMAVLSIYLRQRGSPESKPVGAPHEVDGARGLTSPRFWTAVAREPPRHEGRSHRSHRQRRHEPAAGARGRTHRGLGLGPRAPHAGAVAAEGRVGARRRLPRSARAALPRRRRGRPPGVADPARP